MSQALFPGWRPSADERERLAGLAEALTSACPQHGLWLQRRRPDQWHATLCFIGYDLRDVVTPAMLDAFAHVAATIPAHHFSIERLAYWPQSGAVVALPHPCAELQALCDGSRDAIRRCGIRPLQVTTQPHITLAYLDKHLPVQAWLDDVDCSGEPLHAHDFELLFNPGGRYEAVARWQLTGDRLPPVPEQTALF